MKRTNKQLRGIDEMILAQMKPNRAYKSKEINVPPNDYGIREAGATLKRLAYLGYVVPVETAGPNKLWMIANEA